MENTIPLLQKGAIIRGTVLNGVIMSERLMDEFLCHYFTSDEKKASELFELLIATERSSFKNKKDIFLIIIKNHFPHFITKYPHFAENIDQLITQRNILAHQMLDTSAEADLKHETEVGFVKFTGGSKLIPYDQSFFNEVQYKIMYCIDALTVFNAQIFPNRIIL